MKKIFLLSYLLLCSNISFAQTNPSLIEWEVDGVEREALVKTPLLPKGQTAPLVFVWHGHGGTAQGMARFLKIHKHWPEAIVVYPQGLKTPGYYDPNGERSGWETRSDSNENKDLKFFDTMIAYFREQGVVDERRIHTTGHSNGGSFTYTLLFERGTIFASIAPSSATANRKYRNSKFKAIPIFHLAGEKDTIVRMEWQMPAIEAILENNECGEVSAWPNHLLCKIYPSKINAPLVTYIHPGGHKMPKDSGELFAKFFKNYPKGACKGINLPTTQGTTNSGAFLPGIYQFNYTEEDLKRIQANGFTRLRIPFNASTALDADSLERIAKLFQAVNNQGILCFFDTRQEEEGTHGDGRPNDLTEMIKSWTAINKRFQNFPGIYYELFNEPFGYTQNAEGSKEYVSDMQEIIKGAKLPKDRCILDGLGYANNIAIVANSGWQGELAYHFYPSWMPDGLRTQENFSNRIQTELKNLSQRVHITEFGANLRMNSDYETYTADGSIASQDRNALRGFHDAVIELRESGKGVKSTYHWHGWHNGDSYDMFDKASRGGASKVNKIQEDG
jgi:predicted esterase